MSGTISSRQWGRPPGLFITGTDTGVGKTKITCWLATRLQQHFSRVGVCKPAVSGSQDSPTGPVWDDAVQLRAACALPVPDDWIAPYRWHSPLAPPAAAAEDFRQGRIETPQPNLDAMLSALERWRSHANFVVVEGVGGLLCPLTDQFTVADLASCWGRPILIVARSGLGTLNHTLMTVEIAQARGLRVAGVVLNRVTPELPLSEPSNLAYLQERLTVPVWGVVPYLPDSDVLPAELTELVSMLVANVRY